MSVSRFSPWPGADWLCINCTRHWGFHRAGDESCPVRVDLVDYRECARQRGFTTNPVPEERKS